MDPNNATDSPSEPIGFVPRKREIEQLLGKLPIKGNHPFKYRIYNVWGDWGVGKSTYIHDLRECEFMTKEKVLWIQPTTNSTIDSPQEFIAACSKNIRYPNAPEKEKPIAESIDAAQRGKVNPIVSDDSMLITRSSLAAKKKPYINEAAAASVGRTIIEKEDIQVSVGLGENKAGNQAEGLLDAIPLQSLGTNLTIIYFQDWEAISIEVRDWLKNYVIPAANKGPYKRNIVFLIESREPISLTTTPDQWADWETQGMDFRLYPFTEDDTYEMALDSKLSAKLSRFVFVKSLGYPSRIAENIRAAESGNFEDRHSEIYTQIWASLSHSEKLELSASCLCEELYPGELDAIFGKGKSSGTLDWLKAIRALPIKSGKDGKSISLPDSFRCFILENAKDLRGLSDFQDRWYPFARMVRNVPAKGARTKLLMLSRLNWIDADSSEAIFHDQAEKVMKFIQSKPVFFIAIEGRHKMSELLRSDLIKIAINMEHSGEQAIFEKATNLWVEKNEEIKAKIEELDSNIKSTQEDIQNLNRRHLEANAYLRVMEKKNNISGSTATARSRKRNPMATIAPLGILAIAAIATSSQLEYPTNIGAMTGGLAALCIALALIPSWLQYRNSSGNSKSLAKDSPEFLRQESTDLNHTIMGLETSVEDMKRELTVTKQLLAHPYV